MTTHNLSTGQTTIAAQATAAGNGAIAIIRLSGPMAHQLLGLLFSPSRADFTDFVPWRLYHGTLHDDAGRRLDEVLCVYMPSPRTYTGEDCAEIHCHGGQLIVSSILQALFAAGAVPARRGEFSYRAFLNGRMDLSQAEAVAEMIAAPGRQALEQSLRRLDGELARRVEQVRTSLEHVRVQMSLAVDFPEDDVEILDRKDFLERVQAARKALNELLAGFARASVLQNGARVVLAGSVNAGKSSLMNALLGRNRALVTDVPGTTRDFLEEGVLFEDLPVRLVDTAGVRESTDLVEAQGIARSREQIAAAQCLILVVDGAALGEEGWTAPLCPDPVVRELLQTEMDTPCVVLWNKVDRFRPAPSLGAAPSWCTHKERAVPCLCVSAQTGENLDLACSRIRSAILDPLPEQEADVAPNDRQADALDKASRALDALVRDIEAGQLYDLLSVHLDTCCSHLDDVIGVGTAQDVLNRVFESFCIGK